jgi:hypothetical protein
LAAEGKPLGSLDFERDLSGYPHSTGKVRPLPVVYLPYPNLKIPAFTDFLA